jgi:hypothetical protein
MSRPTSRSSSRHSSPRHFFGDGDEPPQMLARRVPGADGQPGREGQAVRHHRTVSLGGSGRRRERGSGASESEEHAAEGSSRRRTDDGARQRGPPAGYVDVYEPVFKVAKFQQHVRGTNPDRALDPASCRALDDALAHVVGAIQDKLSVPCPGAGDSASAADVPG